MSSYLNVSTEQLYKEAEESFGFKVTNITNNPDFGIKIEHVSLGDVPHNKKLALFLSKVLFHFKVVVYPHQNDLLPMQYTEYAKQFAKKDKFSAVLAIFFFGCVVFFGSRTKWRASGFFWFGTKKVRRSA